MVHFFNTTPDLILNWILSFPLFSPSLLCICLSPNFRDKIKREKRLKRAKREKERKSKEIEITHGRREMERLVGRR
jgi:hypothetical protein